MHRKRVFSNEDYKLGEFAQCTRKGRCKGMRLVSLLGPALSLSIGHPLGTLISHKLPHMTLMDPIGPEPIHGWLESWPKSRICSHQVRLWILTRPATRYQGNRPNFKENSVRRKEIQTKTS
ncbi:hypothetical protein POTOM_020049 [Populus tomentosa]|uniref:Uncharacterized protein n=1 Tax=Populus tomentosa TaxID=118781 RepID=A0A8X7ZVM1_POPTO|nr:hypothetical protein POTOM_020049 [Populus tomentosa]